jgi:SET domain-containing protein
MSDVPVSCKSPTTLPDIIKGTSIKVEVRKSSVHGYGVFAKEPVNAGELIEECKLLRLGWRSNYQHDPIISDYAWGNKSCNCDECKMHGFPKYMALGLGSIYNHSDQPNTKQKLDFETETMSVWANKDILPGEEIFVNYGSKYWVVRDFWAQVNKNKQLEKFHQEEIKPKVGGK